MPGINDLVRLFRFSGTAFQLCFTLRLFQRGAEGNNNRDEET